MGYAHYALPDGREAGYAVEDICNQDDCDTEIDRGLGHLCGQTPGGDEFGCGKYFCDEHLYVGEESGWRCKACLDAQTIDDFVSGMADTLTREITST